MRIRMSVFVCGVSACLGWPGHAGDYVWNQADQTTAFGDITVSYDADGDVDVLSKAGSEAVSTFSGGDMTFAAGGTVGLNGGSLVFSNKVVSAGAMSVSAPDAIAEEHEYAGGFITPTPVLAFTGMTLADCEPVRAYLDTDAGRGWATAYFIKRGDGWMSAEFQLQDGSLVKGVILTLSETAEGLVVSCENCSRYYKGTAGSYEFALAPNGKTLVLATTTTSQSGYGADKLVVSVAEKVVSSVAFAGAINPGGALAFSGRELNASFGGMIGNGGVFEHPLTVAASSLSFAETGDLTFQGDLSGTNATLRFAPTDRVCSADRKMTIDRTARLFRRDFSVDAIRLDGLTVEKFCQDTTEYTAETGGTLGFVVCFVNRQDDGVHFQVQYANSTGGNWNKCVHARLFQQGDDVYVETLRSYWIKADICSAGTYDVVENPNGYDSTTLKSGDSTYFFKNLGITYDSKMDIADAKYEGTISSTPCVLSESADLDKVATNLIAVSALRQGTTASGDLFTDRLTVCFVERESDGVYFQVQVADGSWTKCVHARIYQVGKELKVQEVMSYWVKLAHCAPGAYDMANDPDNRAALTSDAEGMLHSKLENYSLEDCSVRCVDYGLRVRMPGASERFSNVTVDLGEGAYMSVTASNAFPHGGAVIVRDGAELALRCESSAACGTGNGTPINVSTGGLLTVSGKSALRSSGVMQALSVDGGTANFTCVGSSAPVAGQDQSANYVNLLTLSNGGRLVGRAVLGCCGVDAAWHVTGSAPSVVDAGLILVGGMGSSATARPTFVWDVADVTDDAGVDAFMNGRISNWPYAGNSGVAMRKSGAGTLRLGCGDCACTGKVEVAAGTLLLGATDALNPGDLDVYPSAPELNVYYQSRQALVLSGGTLASEAGLVNAVRSISVSSDSAIVLADGAELAADEIGTVSASLAITLGAGSRLRIGTTCCLPKSVLRRMTVNGKRAHQDADGYLTGPSGLVLILR